MCLQAPIYTCPQHSTQNLCQLQYQKCVSFGQLSRHCAICIEAMCISACVTDTSPLPVWTLPCLFNGQLNPLYTGVLLGRGI